MAAAGPAILFIFLLAGTGIVTLYTLCYIARCIQVVVEGTAAGQDAVRWPEEPILDWLGQSAILGGIFVIWMAPAGLAAHALRRTGWWANPAGGISS